MLGSDVMSWDSLPLTELGKLLDRAEQSRDWTRTRTRRLNRPEKVHCRGCIGHSGGGGDPSAAEAGFNS